MSILSWTNASERGDFSFARLRNSARLRAQESRGERVDFAAHGSAAITRSTPPIEEIAAGRVAEAGSIAGAASIETLH